MIKEKMGTKEKVRSTYMGYPVYDEVSIDLANESFQATIDLSSEGANPVIVFGKAGTGKSTLINYLRNYVGDKGKKYAVVAPTGIAALNVEGITMHSFFGIPVKFNHPDEDIWFVKYNSTDFDYVKELEVLIIDEVSMISSDKMDSMDRALQRFKKSTEPFGGIKVIMFGDLLQIPPVVPRQEQRFFTGDPYDGRYFFNSRVFYRLYVEKRPIIPIFLTRIYRQGEDKGFAELLNMIRDYDVISASDRDTVVKTLVTRVTSESPSFTKWLYSNASVVLAPVNHIVDTVNKAYLSTLEGDSYLLKCEWELDNLLSELGDYSGRDDTAVNPTIVAQLKNKALREFKSQETLTVKVGAQVIFIRNDPSGQYVNGTVGHIADVIGTSEIVVDVEGSHIKIEREPYYVVRYSKTSDGKTRERRVTLFRHFPIKVAKAITIHKSQGQTFDIPVYVNFGTYNLWDHGMAYVALSRLTSLDKLYLSRPIQQKDIVFDRNVQSFLRRIEEAYAGG
jgi:ATP-dependent exoDNAse (exonuclease V) alpha subunit